MDSYYININSSLEFSIDLKYLWGYIISNIKIGLIWFILPSILVIINDTMAYIFGISFGKTRLIELSPKKTWEGFIGGSISTLFAAFLVIIIIILNSWQLNYNNIIH